jgi:ATP-binding cassette, subfamily B, bacterial MsbA
MIGFSEISQSTLGSLSADEKGGLKRAFRAVKRHRLLVIVLILGNLVISTLEGGSIAFFGIAVSTLTDSGSTFLEGLPIPVLDSIIQTIFGSVGAGGVFLGLIFLGIAAQALRSFVAVCVVVGNAYLNAKVRIEEAEIATRHAMRLNYENISKYPSGTIATLVDQTNGIAVLASMFVKLTLTIMMLSVYGLIALKISSVDGMIFLSIVFLFGLIARQFSLKVRHQASAEVAGQIQVWHRIFEYLNAGKLLRVFNATDAASKQINAARQQQVHAIRKNSIIQGLMTPLFEILVFSGIGALLIIGLVASENPSATIPSLFVFCLVVIRAYPQVATLNKMYLKACRFVPQLGVVEEFMKIDDKEYERTVGVKSLEFQKELAFDSIGYQPSLNSEFLVKDVNITISKGSTVGIIGKSGAGKSTLVNCLTGLIQPTEGRIRVDGQDLRDIDLRSWRNQISVVEQDVTLIKGSVRENLVLGGAEPSQAELENALELAGLKARIMNMPRGIDAEIDSKGDNLSGGERQRIALARALLRKTPIVILDEVTSAMDADLEATVRSSLSRLRGDCTLIIVSHRLGLIKDVDWLIVMESGRVAEEGIPSELMSLDGYFARAWRTSGLETL